MDTFVGVIILNLILSIEALPRPWHSLFHNEPKQSHLSSKDTKSAAAAGSSAHKYFIIRKRMTWLQSQDACEQFCSRLATFPSLDKAEFMSDVLSKLDAKNVDKLPADYFEVKNKYEWGRDRRYWIGLNDMGKEGVWRWARTPYLLNYTKMWYPNQPDHIKKQKVKKQDRLHASASEHCATFWNPVFHIENERHTFNDEPCNMEYYAICDPQPGNTELTAITKYRGWACVPIATSAG